MKETVNVNIGSEAFTLDTDAYRVLRGYLGQIKRHLPATDTETMGDVEVRIAEIFREKAPSAMRVVTINMVRDAMTQMGAPAEFGECPAADGGEQSQEISPRLYRSRKDRSIAGVCAGIAERLEIDTTLVRLVTLLLILFGGLSIWVYIILWIALPEEPLCKPNINQKQ